MRHQSRRGRRVPGLLGALLLVSTSSVGMVVQAQPAPAQYFLHQVVDHVDPTGPYRGEEWTQRYYTSDQYFQGPGHPIFLIFGGEGSIEPSTGLFYPFITEHLAKSFGAFVLQPEHRFYGESQPLAKHDNEASHIRNGNSNSINQTFHLLSTIQQEDPRVQLFTTEQAIQDAMRLVQLIQNETQCSDHKFSKNYCPVIAVGGSYPGFMAAFSRILFPSRVDMAYAASAPMKFYSQQVDQYAYYDHITHVAEQTKTGCAQAVRQSLQMVQNDIVRGEAFHVSQVGICPGTVPGYIAPSTSLNGRFQLAHELMMVIGYTFANDNMASYPPGNGTRLHQACEVFSDHNQTPAERIRSFLMARLVHHSAKNASCWNMSQQLPSGPHATISSGDWSGVGTGTNGESWDFQTCTLLVEAIGFGKTSILPHREWTLEWLTRHCQVRFGVTPQPYELVSRWNFTQAGLVANDVTRILFTNGLQDGWSVGGIQTNLSDSLIAMNFPNGAHHSDLSHVGPSDEDTEDIKQGFQDIQALLSKWLEEIYPVREEEVTR